MVQYEPRHLNQSPIRNKPVIDRWKQ